MTFNNSQLNWLEENKDFIENASLQEIFEKVFSLSSYDSDFPKKVVLGLALIRGDYSPFFLSIDEESGNTCLCIDLGYSHRKVSWSLKFTKPEDEGNEWYLKEFVKRSGNPRNFEELILAARVACQLDPKTQIKCY